MRPAPNRQGDRWEQIKEILDAALDLATDERATFLAQACGADTALRAEIESLLAENEADGVPLLDVHLPEAEAEGRMGRRIGSYQILREIGHGGMGAVYLAKRADAQFQQLVALKLIKRGMDTTSILRRFRNERQILAALNHPNIARLLDGGQTEDGLPYLVMEYIEGKPIDVYCNENKLTTAERLRLFEQVCAAVHFAHQHLVVHRDLKPGNILVKEEGEHRLPKLLDFGIAKFLAPELGAQTLDPTTPTMRLLTPAYASPEQVKGEPVTTISDVYSLGVLLYELLTGNSPYRTKADTPHEVLRAVLEEAPERPSRATIMEAAAVRQPWASLRRELAGELDNIVLMALRKEPSRRYASVEQLGQDIRRYLTGQPVLAYRDSLGYRTQKFIGRHKVAVMAAALLLLVLFGGVIATAWQARVAARQRDRAERRFNEVRSLVNDVLFKYYDELEKLPGSTALRETLVLDAVAHLDQLARDASGDTALLRELATAYLRVGDIRGKPYAPNLGDEKGALASYQKALTLLTELQRAAPDDPALRFSLGQAHSNIGYLLARGAGMTAATKAAEHARQALTLHTELAQREPGQASYHRALATAHIALGDALIQIAEWIPASEPSQRVPGRRETLEHYRQATVLSEALSAAEPDNSQLRAELSRGYVRMGNLLSAIGDFTKDVHDHRAALDYHDKALAIHEALLVKDPTNVRARRNVADTRMLRGETLMRMEKPAEALQAYRQSLPVFEELAALDARNTEARRDLGYLYERISPALEQQGDLPGALSYMGKAVETFTRLFDSGQARQEDQSNLIGGLFRLAELKQKADDHSGAYEVRRKLLALYERLMELAPANATYRAGYAGQCFFMAELLVQFAQSTPAPQRPVRWREARTWYERVRQELQKAKDLGYSEAWIAHTSELVAQGLAKCEAALGHGAK